MLPYSGRPAFLATALFLRPSFNATRGSRVATRLKGSAGLRGLATLSPRLGVSPWAEMRRDGRGLRSWRALLGSIGGRPLGGLAGPEFVSEFETKQDQ
jgi:hypothetical protein